MSRRKEPRGAPRYCEQLATIERAAIEAYAQERIAGTAPPMLNDAWRAVLRLDPDEQHRAGVSLLLEAVRDDRELEPFEVHFLSSLVSAAFAVDVVGDRARVASTSRGAVLRRLEELAADEARAPEAAPSTTSRGGRPRNELWAIIGAEIRFDLAHLRLVAACHRGAPPERTVYQAAIARWFPEVTDAAELERVEARLRQAMKRRRGP